MTVVFLVVNNSGVETVHWLRSVVSSRRDCTSTSTSVCQSFQKFKTTFNLTYITTVDIL